MEHRTDIEVRWGDCDPYRIVFFANFFHWFDHSAWRLFAAAGLDFATLQRRHGFAGMPLVDVQCSFAKPAHAGDKLQIASTVSHWGRSSFKVTHRALRGEDELAKGVDTRVWTIADPANPETPRPAPIPQDVIARLGGQR